MPRVTQKEIAIAAGLSQMTISRALKQDPNVSRATREKIAALAEQMGYRPDPMLKALVSYRRRAALPPALTNLAIINLDGTNRNAIDDVASDLMIGGIVHHAKIWGFNPIPINFDLNTIDSRGMLEAVHQRRINSIVWPTPAWGLDHGSPPFPVNDFYTLTVGWSFSDTMLHSVTNDWQRAVEMTVAAGVKRGYRRIALFISDPHNRRQWMAISHGFDISKAAHPDVSFLPVLTFDRFKVDQTKAIAQWIEQYRPDLIVSGLGGRQILLKIGHQHRLTYPRDYGFGCIDVIDEINPQDTGAVWNRVKTGEVAVDQLYSALLTGTRGTPECCMRILVQPSWHEGTSMPSRR